MRLLSVMLLALGCVLIGPSGAEAAKPKINKNVPKVDLSADSKNADSSSYFTEPLIRKELLAKLKPTAEQTKQIDALQKEFAGKLKELADKANKPADKPAAAPAAPAKGKKAKGKGKAPTSSPANDAIQEVGKLREEFEGKLNDILTEAQKDVLLEIKAKEAEALLSKGGTPSKTADAPAKKKKKT